MYKQFIVALVVFSLLSVIVIHAGIDYTLDKGDKFIYEVRYSVGNIVYTDYFEVVIQDKYLADRAFYDVYAKYYDSSSGITIAKEYKSISSWELNRILPLAYRYGDEFTGVLYLTVPVRGYNSRISDTEPIGAKLLNLRISGVAERNIDIGGSKISIRVAILQGVVDGIDYEALVDYNSGLLVSLRAYQEGRELFTVLLTYSTDYVAILQNDIDTTNQVRHNKSFNQVVPIVLMATISIIILLAIVSYLSRLLR